MIPEEWLMKINWQQGAIAQCVNRVLPIKVGALAKRHFQNNFLKGGFVNGGLHRWKPAKRLLSGKPGAANSYRTLMSSREHLFRELRYVPGIAQVNIRNEVLYAAVHNEGLRAGRGKGFRMPKRQFVGDSKELNAEIEETIENELSKIIKQ